MTVEQPILESNSEDTVIYRVTNRSDQTSYYYVASRQEAERYLRRVALCWLTHEGEILETI